MIDYYEFLQISPNADSETIHRVFRYLAARFHPDNQKSGNPGMFNQLKAAYDILADPARRAKYDTARRREPKQPLSSTIDFMDDLEGEVNRRLAVLAVLYYRRRTSPNFPEVSLADIEERMGFPRDYLDFTLWYLQRKTYVVKTDNAQYALTAEGVDFVETERAKVPTLHRLLTSSSESSEEAAAHSPHATGEVHALDSISVVSEFDSNAAVDAHPATTDSIENRRATGKDRRVGAPDTRAIKVERRGHVKDRRLDATNRRRPN
jgi:curved DNA-binding protein CbpA